MGMLVIGRQRMAKKLLQRTGIVGALASWKLSAKFEAHTRQG